MKKNRHKKASIWAATAVFTIGTAISVQAVPTDASAGAQLSGTVESRTEDQLTVNNENPGAYEGEFIVHLSDETRILDGTTRMPVKPESIENGERLKVYTSAAVTASIPPQAGAKLVLTDIPEDGSAPFYAELAEVKRQAGGYELTDTSGNRYAAPDDCSIFPYLTRNMIYLDQLYEGADCLIWTDGNGTAERIMMFPPYEREAQTRTGWKLESGAAGTEDAVWVYYKEDGTKHTGWLLDQGKWYYLEPETGIMKRGFLHLDGKTYYLLQDGSMMMESKTFTPDENGVIQ